MGHASLHYEYDELLNEDEEKPSDTELLEWADLIQAELFHRGLRGVMREDEKGIITILPGERQAT